MPKIHRVLLVEDNPAEKSLIPSIMSKMANCMPVEVVHTFDEAVAALSEKHFDAVIVDLHLPDTNGLCAARRLVVEYPNTAVLVLGDKEDKDELLNAVELGVHDYVTKWNMDRLSLETAIRGAIRKRRVEKLKTSPEDLEVQCHQTLLKLESLTKRFARAS